MKCRGPASRAAWMAKDLLRTEDKETLSEEGKKESLTAKVSMAGGSDAGVNDR